ncbi:ATP-dependent endonuclease [Vibrio sp. SS-MA-C1-2]|uniref:DUF2813 domain-containing protein n=1 Tax=Vibrio sp. SS-MA-C1-2 TaxID=2908646 RepID=UPI001F2F080A|nr:DUF2813 domain-containing protein [Vibrio sp. SS-MA-C1-2]UJF17533.1 ATP-dependent endonuclease [Vibrio sp. SS-MA-C1-2]
MLLERIEISGFRGIKRLSLSFDQVTVLIGENRWGKSSLLDALSVALSPEFRGYKFKLSDFYQDFNLEAQQTNQLNIVIQWRQSKKNQYKASRYRSFRPYWCNDQGEQKLLYSISASHDGDKVTTQRDFLNFKGEVLERPDNYDLFYELTALHPLLRLRDARRLRNDNSPPSQLSNQIERRLAATTRRLETQPGNVNSGEIKSGLNAMYELLEHYFALRPHPRENEGQLTHSPTPANVSAIERFIQQNNHQHQIIIMSLLSSYLHAKGDYHIRRSARPLLIIEEPEARLHPTLLNQVWQLLQKIPMQQVLTTNSSDLLSITPIYSIRRLVRHSNHTHAYSVPLNKLSDKDLRRISFHVRFHRQGAFFARCWLLVEGETEIWLFNEFAKQCGYNLAAEGVQLVEFAQSGLKSMIRIAKELGIEWHVVTDGDNAGVKYAETTKRLCDNQNLRTRLTKLPSRDIEHFLYNNGYEQLFRDLAAASNSPKLSKHHIVLKALRRHAKPDVALAVAAYSQEQGKHLIPRLLKITLNRVVSLARGVI